MPEPRACPHCESRNTRRANTEFEYTTERGPGDPAPQRWIKAIIDTYECAQCGRAFQRRAVVR